MNEAEVTASERPTSKRPPKKSSPAKSAKSQPNPDLKAQVPFPGIESVMHGNGAVAHVMEHVCDGVIGYPITPSTEISEIYEAYRASGGINFWDRRPFFFEPEGEHSAQSGAMGAALTGGKYISNASSSQGILYGLESHFVTAGKKIGGFVLQIAARVVSRNSLNVMAGHDDVYALLPSGYTIFFGSNPQEAADLAAIAYRSSSLSLIPAANAMDGFSTSHMQSEVLLPEPELLKRYLGDPSERIPCPSVAQEILFGARGRYWQLNHFLEHHSLEFDPEAFDNLKDFLNKKNKFSEDWNPLNILSCDAATVGNFDLGVLNNKTNLIEDLKSNKFEIVFLIGQDNLNFKKKDEFIIYLGSHGDKGASLADIILPGAAFTEQDGYFANLEGKIQKSYKSSYPPGDAKEDWIIVNLSLIHI